MAAPLSPEEFAARVVCAAARPEPGVEDRGRLAHVDLPALARHRAGGFALSVGPMGSRTQRSLRFSRRQLRGSTIGDQVHNRGTRPGRPVLMESCIPPLHVLQVNIDSPFSAPWQWAGRAPVRAVVALLYAGVRVGFCPLGLG
jgi:hypothetical protein